MGLCNVKKMHEKAEWSHAKCAKGLRRRYKAQNSKGKFHNTILSTTKIPPRMKTIKVDTCRANIVFVKSRALFQTGPF